MSAFIVILILVASRATDAFPRDLKKLPRFLESPADAATYLGYVQHKVPDMTSLVDEVAHQNPNAFSHPERPASFSGGDTANGHLPYNLPNFPAMLGQGGAVSAGSGGGSTSGSSGGGAVGTSGTGTNTIGGGGGGGTIPFGILSSSGATSGGGTAGNTGSVGSAGAAINPLGIPSGPSFNIGSNTGGGGGPGMTAGGSGSALIGTSNGGVFQSFVCSSTSVLNSCPTECVEVDPQNGCPSCRSSCSSATGGSSQLGSATINTAPTSCPPYPSNCPQIYSTMQNGCHVCTILQQLHTVPHTTTTVPITHVTCAPVKCLAPCNVGIIMKADGCPACKCPDHV